MKLPSTLLSAILIGIALQTAPSCKKEKDDPDTKAKKESKEEEKAKQPDYCPACGMG